MESPKLPPKSDKFDFLTEAEMTELVQDYYDKTETIKSLVNRFKLPVTGNIQNYFPWFESEELCSHCKGKMYAKPHQRDRWQPNDPKCLECNHSNISNCNCRTCIYFRNRDIDLKMNEKKNLILEYLKQSNTKKIEFSELSAEEKISLGILVRYLSSNDLTHISPLQTKENWKNNKFFILPLINSKILTINLESDFNYINVKENKFNETILTPEFYKMKWDINVDYDGMTTYELFQYLAKPNDFMKLTGEQIFKYWQKMAKDEAQKYLEYNFEQLLGIQYVYSLPIQKLLEYLTSHFSIGQIYNLIWKYTNNTLRFMRERNYLTEVHVQNYLLKCIKTVSEKTIKNNFTLEHYDKPVYLGNSIFTDFFFKYFLKEAGQETRLTPSWFFEKYNFNSIPSDEDEFVKNENIEVEKATIIDVNDEADGDPFWVF